MEWKRAPYRFLGALHFVTKYDKITGRASTLRSTYTIGTEKYLELSREITGRPLIGVNSTRRQFSSPEEATFTVKEKAKELGADISGVCLMRPEFVYAEKNVEHKYAISLGMRMLYDEIGRAPDPKVNEECLRVYYQMNKLLFELANYLRYLGYDSQPHYASGAPCSAILHLPVAVYAGLGELGRHGSLITKELGPMVRLGTVTTDLELSTDSMKNIGVNDMCSNCNLCTKFCPGGAISGERRESQHYPSPKRWVVETEKCIPYFSNAYSCAICLSVCPFNAKSVFMTQKEQYITNIKRINRMGREAFFATLPATTAISERPNWDES